MKPTEAEVAAEIAKLKAMKPRVRQFSHFGDDNWAAIDAQVAVLERRMSEANIFAEWGEGDDVDDDGTNPIIDSAMDALAWAKGDDDEPCSVGWEPLLMDVAV